MPIKSNFSFNPKLLFKVVCVGLVAGGGFLLSVFLRNSFLESEIMKTISVTISDNNSDQLIPKIFHTLWLDFGKGNEVFPEYLENSKKLLELHPGWELKLWKEKEIIELIEEKFPSLLQFFKSYDQPVKKHDFARIVILYCFGGVYIDHDGIPLKNIEPLLGSFEFVLINESVGEFWPSNAFIGSVERFDLLDKYITKMTKPGVAKKDVLSATGPRMFKHVLIENYKKYGSNQLRIYDSKFMFGLKYLSDKNVKNLNNEELRLKYPDCYILHLFDYNWRRK